MHYLSFDLLLLTTPIYLKPFHTDLNRVMNCSAYVLKFSRLFYLYTTTKFSNIIRIFIYPSPLYFPPCYFSHQATSCSQKWLITVQNLNLSTVLNVVYFIDHIFFLLFFLQKSVVKIIKYIWQLAQYTQEINTCTCNT